MILSINCTQSPEQIFLTVHQSFTTPFLIYFYIISTLIFLITGFVMIDGSRGEHPYLKFFLIWLISTILIGVVLAFFIVAPNSIQSISQFLGVN